MSSKEELKSQIREAFRNVQRPGPDALTSHDCWQCNILRDDFARFSQDGVPEEVLLYHCDDLPLLSALGLRYFLPAYLIAGIDLDNISLRENVIFHLSPSETESEYTRDRIAVFSSSEKHAICSYLYYMAEQSWGEVYKDYVAIAMKIWCKDKEVENQKSG